MNTTILLVFARRPVCYYNPCTILWGLFVQRKLKLLEVQNFAQDPIDRIWQGYKSIKFWLINCKSPLALVTVNLLASLPSSSELKRQLDLPLEVIRRVKWNLFEWIYLSVPFMWLYMKFYQHRVCSLSCFETGKSAFTLPITTQPISRDQDWIFVHALFR